SPEHAVHCHEIIWTFRRSHIANSRPLSVPSVSTVVAMAGFWQPVERPFLWIAHTNKHRLVIPTSGPNRISRGIFVTIDSTGTCDFHKLISAYRLPFTPIPFRKHTRLDVEVSQRLLDCFSVVRVHQH